MLMLIFCIAIMTGKLICIAICKVLHIIFLCAVAKARLTPEQLRQRELQQRQEHLQIENRTAATTATSTETIAATMAEQWHDFLEVPEP